ncbi:MAG: Coat F domain protein [Firmicutes bacterium ADurb.Bin182]|nr:MAG: Coat F domain protein [Firmicutes bacterium ADurb.Bin182]
MLNEKEMVNDTLTMLKSSITGYSNVISEAGNPQFRQTIQQIRNNCEQSQYELYKLAEQKGYYQPAAQARQDEIQQIKSSFIQ